jgi:two-component system chemotaxis response regulator CheY
VTLGAVGYILKPLHAADARAHLDKIFRMTLDRLAEDPLTTMQRLNIGAPRLAAYLKAFDQQLVAARAQFDAAHGGGGAGEASIKVDALHNGCMTLGLWEVAAELDLARKGVFDSVRVDQALASVQRAVQRQSARVRAASGSDAADTPA